MRQREPLDLLWLLLLPCLTAAEDALLFQEYYGEGASILPLSHACAKDRRGLIWTGTKEDLVCYDSYEDKQGTVWGALISDYMRRTAGVSSRFQR